MSAHYDYYDYPAYWEKREYEHQSEVCALKELLSKIPKIKKIVEIGAGFGRLTPSYIYRGKQIILTDPSSKLLNLARKKLKTDKKGKVNFIHTSLEHITSKIPKRSADLVIMVRVLHHIKNPEKAFLTINSLLKPNGYLILEFANKSHAKAMIKEMSKGNLTFPLDIFPKDLSSEKNIKLKSLPFVNYHPDIIEEQLKDAGFRIVDRRSVSNIRSTLLKRVISVENLISLEKILQKPLSFVNFGPSIFLLVKKTL